MACKDCWSVNEKVRDQIVGEELIKFAFHLNNREGVSPPTDTHLITMPQVCGGGGGGVVVWTTKHSYIYTVSILSF